MAVKTQTRSACVLRGGAFYGDASYVRCAFRDWNDLNGRYESIGFRVVMAPGFDSDL